MSKTATSLIKKFIAFIRETFTYFMAINGPTKASSLAYATLLSVVPLLVLSFGFLMAFPAFNDYFHALRRYLFRHLVPASANTIQEYVEIFANNAANLSATGLLVFLFTGVILIFEMESVFNSIWKTKVHHRGLSAFLMYWAILTLLPPVAVIAFAGSIYLYSLPYLSSLLNAIALFIPIILSFLGLLFLYMVLPNRQVLFRHAAVGAFISAILFELMKVVFSLYVTYFTTNTIVYGVIAAIPVFLFWLFLVWLIIIYGAVVSYISSTLKTP